MKRTILAIAIALAIALPAKAGEKPSRAATSYAGTNAKKLCHGEWTDMRSIGLSIGMCDLNSVSDRDLERIKSVCGKPWTADEEGRTGKPAPLCQIEALVGSKKPNFHGALVFPVKRVRTIKATNCP